MNGHAPRAISPANPHAAAAPQAVAQVKEKDTIKSLESKTVEVRPGKVILDSSELARQSYRDFLDLVSDDPVLRAEAMRRPDGSGAGGTKAIPAPPSAAIT